MINEDISNFILQNGIDKDGSLNSLGVLLLVLYGVSIVTACCRYFNLHSNEIRSYLHE